MFYLNEHAGPFKHIFNDVYIATTIDDFLTNAKDIPKQSRWKLLSPLYWLNPGFVLIEFSNVQLTFSEDDRYLISDMNSEMYVLPIEKILLPFQIPSHSSRRANLTEGRYEEVKVMYNQSRGKIVLLSTKKFGPPQTEKDADKELSDLELELIPVGNY